MTDTPHQHPGKHLDDPIPLITRDDEAAGSGDVIAANIAKLTALFPEIMRDGEIDAEVLSELVGGRIGARLCADAEPGYAAPRARGHRRLGHDEEHRDGGRQSGGAEAAPPVLRG